MFDKQHKDKRPENPRKARIRARLDLSVIESERTLSAAKRLRADTQALRKRVEDAVKRSRNALD